MQNPRVTHRGIYLRKFAEPLSTLRLMGSSSSVPVNSESTLIICLIQQNNVRNVVEGRGSKRTGDGGGVAEVTHSLPAVFRFPMIQIMDTVILHFYQYTKLDATGGKQSKGADEGNGGSPEYNQVIKVNHEEWRRN